MLRVCNTDRDGVNFSGLLGFSGAMNLYPIPFGVITCSRRTSRPVHSGRNFVALVNENRVKLLLNRVGSGAPFSNCASGSGARRGVLESIFIGNSTCFGANSVVHSVNCDRARFISHINSAFH